MLVFTWQLGHDLFIDLAMTTPEFTQYSKCRNGMQWLYPCICHNKVPCNQKHLVLMCSCSMRGLMDNIIPAQSLCQLTMLPFIITLTAPTKVKLSHCTQVCYSMPMLYRGDYWLPEIQRVAHKIPRTVPCLDLPMLQIFSFPVAPSRLVGGLGWAET